MKLVLLHTRPASSFTLSSCNVPLDRLITSISGWSVLGFQQSPLTPTPVCMLEGREGEKRGGEREGGGGEKEGERKEWRGGERGSKGKEWGRGKREEGRGRGKERINAYFFCSMYLPFSVARVTLQKGAFPAL